MWFNGLFGEQKASKQPEKTAGKPNQKVGNKRNNPNRRQHQNQTKSRRPQPQDGETAVAAGNEQSKNRLQQDKQRQAKNQDRQPENKLGNHKADNAKSRTPKSSHHKQMQPENSDALNVVNEQTTQKTRSPKQKQPKQKPLIVQLGEPATREHSSNRKSNGQNNRRQQPAKRHIPSAAKMEHYLNVGEAAERVEDAIVHVLRKGYPDLAAESRLVAEYDARETNIVVPDVEQFNHVGEQAVIVKVANHDVELNHHDNNTQPDNSAPLVLTSEPEKVNFDDLETASDDLFKTWDKQPETTAAAPSHLDNVDNVEVEIAEPFDLSDGELENVSAADLMGAWDATTEAPASSETVNQSFENPVQPAPAMEMEKVATLEAVENIDITETPTTQPETTVETLETVPTPSITPVNNAKLDVLANVDLGQLQMVETSPRALIADAMRIEPPRVYGKRYRDLPIRMPSDEKIEMIQVETIR